MRLFQPSIDLSILMSKINELAQAIDRNTTATKEAVLSIQERDERQKELIEKARNGGASDKDFDELINIVNENTTTLNNIADTQNQTNILIPSPTEPQQENTDKLEEVESDDDIEINETEVGLPGSVAIDVDA